MNSNRSAVLLAQAGLLFAAALNWHHLAWWSLPVLAVATAWRLRATLAAMALPGRAVRISLALLLTIGVLASFRTLNGLQAGATLLAAMSAAKLLETRAVRDWFVINGAALFLLLAACLDSQQLWRLPLYGLCVWLIAAALRGQSGSDQPVPLLLRSAGRQLLLAAPLALALFLLFPRLPGAFWAMPAGEEAITGLGNEMSPGSIARLVESDDTALRARFTGPLPPPQLRYWRGPVLHDFDGFTWRRQRDDFLPAIPLEYQGPAYHYLLTLEPNSHGDIVALEMPLPLQLRHVRYSADYELVATQPITQAQSFELTAYPQARSKAELSRLARRVDLALPADRNPRSRELALQLRASARDDADYIARVLDYLRTGGFEYTLVPPLLGRDSVDDLLFGSRQGFCAHYASAFVTLMRAAGVPARVVTGYLGGEWNPIGQYLNVRQSDAHAWAEVWLPGQGWVRTDPTAVVAPERIQRGLFDLGAGFARSKSRLLATAPWLASALQGWQALNAWWQDEFVGFNFAQQLDLVRWLGLGDGGWQALAAALGMALLAWLAWIGWTLRRALRAQRPDELARAWRRVDARLARAGLPRPAHEGVMACAARLGTDRPALRAALSPLARGYADLRYGPPAPPAQLREFLALARRFRVPAEGPLEQA